MNFHFSIVATLCNVGVSLLMLRIQKLWHFWPFERSLLHNRVEVFLWLSRASAFSILLGNDIIPLTPLHSSPTNNILQHCVKKLLHLSTAHINSWVWLCNVEKTLMKFFFLLFFQNLEKLGSILCMGTS